MVGGVLVPEEMKVDVEEEEEVRNETDQKTEKEQP